jgi:hypothetical protein
VHVSARESSFFCLRLLAKETKAYRASPQARLRIASFRSDVLVSSALFYLIPTGWTRRAPSGRLSVSLSRAPGWRRRSWGRRGLGPCRTLTARSRLWRRALRGCRTWRPYAGEREVGVRVGEGEEKKLRILLLFYICLGSYTTASHGQGVHLRVHLYVVAAHCFFLSL